MQKKASAEGLTKRHSRACGSNEGRNCNCEPSYQAWVYDRKAKKKIRRTFSGAGAFEAAKAWRRDAAPLASKQGYPTANGLTLNQAWDEWLAKAEAGEILSRFRRPYKGSALRGYKADMTRYVLDDLGAYKLAELSADDFQSLVERLIGKGLSGQKVRNILVPAQALYRRYRRQVLSDPTDGLDLPEGAGRRSRAATPQEAAQLLSALPLNLRAIYATAFYAGLRRGELRALRLSDVGETSLRVEQSYDDYDGIIDPKSSAGKREVPIPATLRVVLDDYLAERDRTDDAFFGPFTPSYVSDSADEAWAAAVVGAFLRREPIALDRITLHECRHSYSTFLDAAGVSEARADRFMGHSNSSVQARYRHSLPQVLKEDGERLEAYLTGSTEGKVQALRAAG